MMLSMRARYVLVSDTSQSVLQSNKEKNLFFWLLSLQDQPSTYKGLLLVFIEWSLRCVRTAFQIFSSSQGGVSLQTSSDEGPDTA